MDRGRRQPQGSRRPRRAYLGELHPGPLRPPVSESDAALRDRLDALYTAGQRDQDAALVDLFQERSRPQRHPRTPGTPPALGR